MELNQFNLDNVTLCCFCETGQVRQAVFSVQIVVNPGITFTSADLFIDVGGIGVQVKPAQVHNMPKVIRTVDFNNIVYNELGGRVQGTLAAGDSNNSAVVIAVASLGHSIVLCLFGIIVMNFKLT